MLVHRKRKPRYQMQAPLTSLIDIIFMLLIYFLLTTNFIVDEGIKIKLPQAKAAQSQINKEITVYVDKNGQAFLGGNRVTEGLLFKTLKEMLCKRKDKLVIIKADRTVVLNKAVKIMDLAKAAGAGRLCLATEKEL